MTGDVSKLRQDLEELQQYVDDRYGYDVWLHNNVGSLLTRIEELEIEKARGDSYLLMFAVVNKNVNRLYEHLGLQPPTPLDDLPQNISRRITEDSAEADQHGAPLQVQYTLHPTPAPARAPASA